MAKPIPRPKMSRTDYVAMALCYAVIGSIAWAVITANIVPLIVALTVAALACIAERLSR